MAELAFFVPSVKVKTHSARAAENLGILFLTTSTEILGKLFFYSQSILIKVA